MLTDSLKKTDTCLNVLIVDDEAAASQHLLEQLRHALGRGCCPRIACSAAQGRSMIQSLTPDLLFLDVEMPGEDGFQLLESLGPQAPITIFVTAYRKFAIRALKASALDYLLKPVDPLELSLALQKARHKLEEDHRIHQKLEQAERLQSLKEHLQAKSASSFVLQEASGPCKLMIKEIAFLEGSRNYSRIYLQDGTQHLSSRNLAYFEDSLPEDRFCRVHKSYLIHLAHLRQARDREVLISVDGHDRRIPISRRRKKNFLLQYSQFSQRP